LNRSQPFMVALLLIAGSFGQASRGQVETPFPPNAVGQGRVIPEADARYNVRVSVDEVRLTFHAVDKSGQPVDDLKPSDLDLFDNQTGPGAIVDLQLLKGRPLRVGILIDRSGSVSNNIARSRAIAIVTAQALLRNESDQGLVVSFRRARNIHQPWSRDLNAVTAGLRQIGSRDDASLDGTSLFDGLWSTCFYEFREQGEDAQNVLLLLTDGVDTSSHATLEQAIGACQQAHTSIFVLTSTPEPSALTVGSRALRTMAEQTGGSIIPCGGSELEVRQAIDSLATHIRNEYQLFYRPRDLKRDGSFHRIVLVGPPRVADIVGQSGYYALPK
jgi:Ca-activated chloride channel homolog